MLSAIRNYFIKFDAIIGATFFKALPCPVFNRTFHKENLSCPTAYGSCAIGLKGEIFLLHIG
jgi:hypothetical protein